MRRFWKKCGVSKVDIYFYFYFYFLARGWGCCFKRCLLDFIAWNQDRKNIWIFVWEIIQGERQFGFEFSLNFFCKAHKSKRIWMAHILILFIRSTSKKIDAEGIFFPLANRHTLTNVRKIELRFFLVCVCGCYYTM